MATPVTNRGHRPFAIAVIVIAVIVATYLDYAELANVLPTVGMKLVTGPARYGIAHGIEAACKVLMPILIVLLIALAGYSIVEGDVAATARFFFALTPERVTARAALDALGLGFFSIGVGFALMVTYAAYAGRDIQFERGRGRHGGG